MGERDERHAGGDEGPGHHNPGEPQSRADLVQDDIARHLEQHIAEKEDAGPKAVDGLAECKLVLHLQLGEADIDAIEIGGEVAKEEKRDQAPSDLAEDIVFGADIRCQAEGGVVM